MRVVYNTSCAANAIQEVLTFAKNRISKIALCGVLSALSVVVLLVGNVLQIGTYAAPMLASFLLIPVLEDYGKKYALLLYAVVSLLSLFLVPDKELVLFYVLVLGYYPVLRVRLNNIRRGVLRWMAKFGCFNAAVVVMYALLIVVLAPPELVQEFAAEGTPCCWRCWHWATFRSGCVTVP